MIKFIYVSFLVGLILLALHYVNVDIKPFMKFLTQSNVGAFMIGLFLSNAVHIVADKIYGLRHILHR